MPLPSNFRAASAIFLRQGILPAFLRQVSPARRARSSVLPRSLRFWPEMGIPIIILGKFGIPGVQSVSIDAVFKQFFTSNIQTFDHFQFAFLDFWDVFNKILPGRHYKAPPREKIKECYALWQSKTSSEEKKKVVLELLEKHSDAATAPKESNSALVMTGMVAPAASMILKRAGESMPQMKFRLHLIPDAVFVPSCTVLALIGAKFLQLKSSDLNNASESGGNPAAAA